MRDSILAPLHLQDLRKSGLSDETIKAAGFASIRPCDIAKEIGFNSSEIESAYTIPFDKNYSRYKLFYMAEAKAGVKRPKYTQKKGTANRLYVAPSLTETVLKSLSKLCFTEGEKKAAKATQDGLNCIGITGLWNWKIKGTDELIADFDKIELAGREINIIPDSDWLDLGKDGKPKNLKDAVYRFATALMLRGAIVRIVFLPTSDGGKIGLDDYLLGHSVEEFKNLKTEKVTPKPCFRNERGSLLFYGVDDEGAFKPPVTVCSSIVMLAFTRDRDNKAWGRLLQFKDRDGNTHTWPMPMDMLSGDCTELRSMLYHQGLSYIAKGKTAALLPQYLQTTYPDKGRRARCVDSTGWHGDKLFILPSGQIGSDDSEDVVYQGNLDSIVSQKGCVTGWIDTVGKYCAGNSRLIFAVSMAFTAPILNLIGSENFGANFSGGSSTGKTTALRVACSVWGGRDYMLRWRATGNGLEGTATAHNDLFMALDELAEVSPHEAGSIAYMLANGDGKKRANRDGSTRVSKKWRLCFLSAGEITLSEHMATAGKQAKAGQEVRLADVPANTGKYGVFENLHSFDSGGKLSQHFVHATGEQFGHVGLQFLRHLVEDSLELPNAIRAARAAFVSSTGLAGADGQVMRVAGFFGTVAAAGEYATSNGLTGWQAGEATAGASACFKSWLDQRGGSGAREVDRIIDDLRLFIEAHGASRFALKNSEDTRIIINRAGYRDGATYYIMNESFRKEVLKGHNFTLARKILTDKGILLAGNSPDRHTQKISVDGQKMNVFVIDADKLNGGEV